MTDLSFLDRIPDPLAPGDPPKPQAPSRRVASPDRNALGRRRMVALAISLAWLVTHLTVYGIRQDFSALPAGYVAAQVLLPVLVAVGCAILALSPGRLGLGLGIGLLSGVALLGPLSFLAAATLVQAPVSEIGRLGFWLGALMCLDITLSWASVPLVAAVFSLRRSFAARAGWRSALVGAAVGLFSGAAINLHCANADPAHIVAGHAVPVALLAVCGGLLAVRWLRA